MWYSMMYLPLAEATVITFLAPGVSGYICHLVLKDPFTRKEQLASFIALAGVVLIARPTSLFSGFGGESQPSIAPIELPGNLTETLPHPGDEPTPTQRLWAIGVALIGVLGASGAFTFIRWIGKRAHPLISVTYFSVWCTIVSTTVLVIAPLIEFGQPAIRFGLPASLRQWLLLISLGVTGFIMQFMLTAGLGGEKSNRATAMVYTHMLFAAGFDKWIFGHEMSVISLLGCGLIIGSALWAALSKKEQEKKPNPDVEQNIMTDEEGIPMLGVHGVEEDDDGEEEEAIPLEHVR
jgi:drug/metabolite transporter (DMT)-like permease